MPYNKKNLNIGHNNIRSILPKFISIRYYINNNNSRLCIGVAIHGKFLFVGTSII